MLIQILLHTPRWVFALLAALLALGASQLATRRVGLPRMVLMPATMTGLSFYSVWGGFAAQPLALLAWVVATLATTGLMLANPTPATGTRYDPVTRHFTLPGSWVPLALIVGIFCTKYAVGFVLSLTPPLALEPSFALPLSALYGTFGGVFLGRALRNLRLVGDPVRGGAAPQT